MRSSTLALVVPFTLFAPLHAQIVQTEPNDSIGTATSSTLVAGSSGGVTSMGNNGDGPFGPTTGNSTGDFDFFSVAANAGQVIVFDVNSNINGTGVDTVIGIYNSAGVLVASNDDDGISRDSFVRYTVAADDTYYLVVGNWVSGAADDAGSLPTNINVEGTGRGVPGGGVDDYEVVILLDGGAYFSNTAPGFPVSAPDEVSEGGFSMRNEGGSTATITAINITGAGAAAFSIDQVLPLTVAAGEIVTFDIEFDPSGSDEEFSAEIEIVSDDIIHPSLVLPLTAKAINGLLFRLPFDDPAGSPTGQFGSPAETSGNNFGAAMVVNAGAPAPGFGSAPIAGTEGFSTMFNDAGASGNYVLTANGFPNTPSFTYSLWIRPIAGSGEDTLFNRDPAFSQADNIFGCTIKNDGQLVFRIGGSEIVASEPGAVVDGTVYHVVVTHYDSTGFGDFSADRTRLFIDGAMVAENTTTNEIPEYSEGAGNSRLWIGTRSAAGTGFNGEMDDFQIYNIELDPIEIMELFDNPGTVLGEAPSAPLAVTAFSRSADGKTVDLTFDSRPGRTYSLEFSTDLSNWAEATDSIASQGLSTTTSFTDSFVFTEATLKIYFRLVEVAR